jgi:hypothetical protein
MVRGRRSSQERRMRIAFLLLVGCASEPPPDPPPPITELRFVGETPSGAHVVQLEGSLDGSTLSLELVGRDLGAIFGWSAHVTWDPAVLSLEDATIAGVIDAPSPEGRLELVREREGDLAIAETRTDRALGDATVERESVLASLHFALLREAESAVSLERVVVRDASAAFVAMESGGGSLVEMEVTP